MEKNVGIKLETLTNILVRCQLLTPMEGQIFLMTLELPTDMNDRISSYIEQESL